MKVKQQPFLSNLVGQDKYEDIRAFARLIVPIGTIVLIVLFLLSCIVHWDFISTFLGLCTGTSLLFIAYIVSILFVLDIRVDVLQQEDLLYNSKISSQKPLKYKFTVAWTIVLCLLGISAIYLSNEYRKEYRFKGTSIN